MITDEQMNDFLYNYNYGGNTFYMKLKIDKFYKTRNKKKVYITYIDEKNGLATGCILSYKKTFKWSLSGKYSAVIHNLDLISEWEN